KNLAAYLDSINTKTLITLGGVGVSEEPKKPKVFCTANSAGILSEFKSEFPLEDAYGSIGPISGLAGLMLCDASRHNISSICLVSETVSNPFFIGLDAARELVNILTAKYDFGIDPGSFDSLFPKDSSQQPPHQADQAVQTGLDYIG
ncbi:MAG TPA: hypothetical protein ENN46_02385, partial [Candidatus Woesearchaeota archaeon]|nr:hypothetical protein [Candidatus Woesearchaeota archaeon]